VQAKPGWVPLQITAKNGRSFRLHVLHAGSSGEGDRGLPWTATAAISLLALFAGQLGGYKVTVFDDGDDGLDGQGEGGLPSEELGSEGTEGSIDHSTAKWSVNPTAHRAT